MLDLVSLSFVLLVLQYVEVLQICELLRSWVAVRMQLNGCVEKGICRFSAVLHLLKSIALRRVTLHH